MNEEHENDAQTEVEPRTREHDVDAPEEQAEAGNRQPAAEEGQALAERQEAAEEVGRRPLRLIIREPRKDCPRMALLDFVGIIPGRFVAEHPELGVQPVELYDKADWDDAGRALADARVGATPSAVTRFIDLRTGRIRRQERATGSETSDGSSA